MGNLILQKWPLIPVIALLSVMGIVGVAVAQSSSSGDVIHACYQTANGQLRIVSEGSDCRPSETAISWNADGPQGQPGPQGAEGPPGPGLPTYAAYLQPSPEEQAVNVGWGSSNPAPLEIQYIGSGHYRFVFSRADGLGCAVPVATPFTSVDVGLRVVGMGCTATEATFRLVTSDGADHSFLIQVAFTR
jgi:hypothetical protein